MQYQRPGPQARLGPACPGCRQPPPRIRRQFAALYKGTFYFHFENLCYANGRKTTFLCYRVERLAPGLPVYLWKGVFRNQVFPLKQLHAELCFLYWFHNHILSPNENYRITWYVSWSSCPNCAWEVARFLAAHQNVTLTIHIARLYYFWNDSFKQGLRRLSQERAQLAIMDGQGFQYCWDEFVYNDGKPFRPWRKLNINFNYQDHNLQEILRSLLKEETFLIQFNNKHRAQKPYRRRKTYLCYKLEGPSGSGPLTKGCLQNKKGKHAEARFVDKMRSMQLDHALITCYLTWSPCLDCSQKLAALKRDHPGLTLRIFTSRLYFHWVKKFQEGLRLMFACKIQVAVMGLPEFTDCWENFVSDQPFSAWHKLEDYSQSIKRRLNTILMSFRLDDITENIGNLQLAPPSF
uniref:DNA dC->dU-editing enzyme APOBEC-3-like isoform X1 n=1 Tax=Jaculus jaculus TaxID=51337 RepID=UPI001E1B3425|nr:DNA dC->dU-editing enzyme APOBEC-3-like isoform X1 [Jaculus jaculus]